MTVHRPRNLSRGRPAIATPDPGHDACMTSSPAVGRPRHALSRQLRPARRRSAHVRAPGTTRCAAALRVLNVPAVTGMIGGEIVRELRSPHRSRCSASRELGEPRAARATRRRVRHQRRRGRGLGFDTALRARRFAVVVSRIAHRPRHRHARRRSRDRQRSHHALAPRRRHAAGAGRLRSAPTAPPGAAEDYSSRARCSEDKSQVERTLVASGLRYTIDAAPACCSAARATGFPARSSAGPHTLLQPMRGRRHRPRGRGLASALPRCLRPGSVTHLGSGAAGADDAGAGRVLDRG